MWRSKHSSNFTLKTWRQQGTKFMYYVVSRTFCTGLNSPKSFCSRSIRTFVIVIDSNIAWVPNRLVRIWLQ